MITLASTLGKQVRYYELWQQLPHLNLSNTTNTIFLAGATKSATPPLPSTQGVGLLSVYILKDGFHLSI